MRKINGLAVISSMRLYNLLRWPRWADMGNLQCGQNVHIDEEPEKTAEKLAARAGVNLPPPWSLRIVRDQAFQSLSICCGSHAFPWRSPKKTSTASRCRARVLAQLTSSDRSIAVGWFAPFYNCCKTRTASCPRASSLVLLGKPIARLKKRRMRKMAEHTKKTHYR